VRKSLFISVVVGFLIGTTNSFSAPELEYCGTVKLKKEGSSYRHDFNGKLMGGRSVRGFIVPLNGDVVAVLPDRGESLEVCMKGTAWTVRQRISGNRWTELHVYEVTPQ